MRTWCLIAMLALASCGKDEAKASKAPPPPSEASKVETPTAIELFVDDASVGKITAEQIATWPRLDTLVPVAARRLGTWDRVFLKGKAPKPSELHRPSDTYPELVPALFPGDSGAPAFGMFDPVELAKHGKPALREDMLHEIRIKLAQGQGRGEHESGEGGGQDPTLLKVAIKTPQGASVLEGKTLLAIPREPQPGDDSKEPKGWTLATVLDAAGIKKFERILLTDSAGLNLTLDKADVDPAKSVPFLKLNRSGQLRFRVFKKQGDAWRISGDLRGITSIEVLK